MFEIQLKKLVSKNISKYFFKWLIYVNLHFLSHSKYVQKTFKLGKIYSVLPTCKKYQVKLVSLLRAFASRFYLKYFSYIFCCYYSYLYMLSLCVLVYYLCITCSYVHINLCFFVCWINIYLHCRYVYLLICTYTL